MNRDLIRRTCGSLLILAALISFRPGSATLFHQLLIPLLFVCGVLLVTKAYLATALAVAALAAVATAPGSEDPVPGLVYPAIAAIAGGLSFYILIQRFRGHIDATHDERWQARTGSSRESRR